MTYLRLLLPVLLVLASPAFAQKTSQPQEMAKPGESTEPPKPRAAPMGDVEMVPLPRSGAVLVFGGTQGTGLEAVKQLVAMKEHVTVITEGAADDPALQALGVTLSHADVRDPETLKEVFRAMPYRVVVSALGPKQGAPRDYDDDNKSIVDTTKAMGVPRVILISMIGAGDSEDAMPWLGRFVFKNTLAERAEAENYLKASGLEYTIVRSGGLLHKATSGQATLTTDASAYSWIASVDLGKLIADCAKDDRTANKVFTAFDPTRTNILAYFRN